MSLCESPRESPRNRGTFSISKCIQSARTASGQLLLLIWGGPDGGRQVMAHDVCAAEAAQVARHALRACDEEPHRRPSGNARWADSPIATSTSGGDHNESHPEKEALVFHENDPLHCGVGFSDDAVRRNLPPIDETAQLQKSWRLAEFRAAVQSAGVEACTRPCA